MAKTEEKLVTVLEASAAVNTHFGATPATRITPGLLPQNPTLPAMTYHRIAGAPVSSMDGLDAMDNGLYQLDVWASTQKAAREAADAVRDAIDASADLGSTLLSVSTDYEPDTKPALYRVSMDLSLWHLES